MRIVRKDGKPMTKKLNLRGIIFASLLAIVMVIAGIGFGHFGVDRTYATDNAVTVTFQAEGLDNGSNYFIVKPMSVTVEPGYAATVDSNWTNDSNVVSSTQVSALDVLAAVHTAMYGSSFTSNPTNYISGSNSYITGMFGQTNTSCNSSGIMFGVNDTQPNNGILQSWTYNGVTTQGYMTYAINQSVVHNGDVVNYFFMKDSSWADYYTYFKYNGTATRAITVQKNTNFTLNLEGYKYFEEGYMANWNKYNMSGALVYQLANSGTYGATMDTYLKTTNSAGNCTLKFTAAGTYYVSAVAASGSTPIIPPYIKIVVTE